MAKYKLAFVAFDSAKDKHAVAIAEDGRDGEVRYFGEIENSPDAVKKFVAKLRRRYDQLHFCYEAGPTGYGLHRQLTDLGYVCDVVAPTMIPKRSGDRVKTNRRDAVTLVKLLRAGELRTIWVPDTVHEAVRDLARAREAAMRDLKVKRQQLLSFLLRHGRSFPDGKNWTKMHARWLTAQKFAHPAHQIVFQDQIEAINAAQVRLASLEQQLRDIVPTWTMAPVVAAYQALRGVSSTSTRSRRASATRRSWPSPPDPVGAAPWAVLPLARQPGATGARALNPRHRPPVHLRVRKRPQGRPDEADTTRAHGEPEGRRP
jgi:transposase